MRVSCPMDDYDTDEREEDFGIMKKGAVAKHKTCYSLFFHPDLALVSQSTGHYHPEIMISVHTLAP
jgi:hypothetical protein